MKFNNSNKRISNIIAGILFIFAVGLFIAIALGVVGNHLYIQEKLDPLNIGSQFNLVDNSPELSGDIGNHKFVPVAQICPAGDWDTASGSIEVIQQDLADLFEFPLCFDPTDPESAVVSGLLDTWFRVYKVCGGYYPCEFGTQEFNLYQYDKDQDEYVIVTSPGYYVGWSLDWHELTAAELAAGSYGDIVFTFDTTDDCCCTSYWVVTINTDCGNPGCLDSNKFPTVPADCETIPEDLTGTIPGKDVIAEIEMTWCGCPDPAQCFELILVQIIRIPNLR